MKQFYPLFVFLLLVMNGLTSCFSSKALSISESDNNPSYVVSYLFEHDGCRVYRFYDRRSHSYVYFTTQGDVTSIPNDSTRQQTVTYRQIETKKIVP